ncbi:glycosyltransferase family 4 protein [Endozoicomonas sp. SM1973]|uniref:Glycosyltransferase family 4 protein n=1 Tax=Spartinivicinus marinus TaxID=2994442 RepID=A0A853I8H1_9GAMM|nr:glycosyltransferase family 4 protein [Spartinivicinus marinus]MCX4030304.1 glycosyltransferase family 4 protein [Spartinivicinus marinus]NYZ69613.1 glycosyltransferase family 4 protein [Spartinivicinus marinus]
MLTKLTFICLYPPALDGSAFSNAELIHGLAQKGYKIDVIAQPCEGDHAYDIWTKQKYNVNVYRVPIELVYEGTPPSEHQYQVVHKFIKNILEKDIEKNMQSDLLIIGHDSWAWYQPLAHQYGLTVVQHLRGTPTRSILNGIYPDSAKNAFLRCILAADYIVAHSKHFEHLVSKLGYSKHKTYTLYQGIDTNLFCPEVAKQGAIPIKNNLGLPSKSKIILHVSNHCPVKRIQDIIHSAEIVIAKQPDTYYVIVGEGPETNKVKAAIEQSAFPNHFRLTGRVSRQDIPSYLGLGEIFILSSETEGFPRATLEAQACGLYLIISDMPAGRERTLNGLIGTNYQVGDPKALAAATLEVLSMSANKFYEVTSRAKNYVKQECSFYAQLDKYELFLNKVYAEKQNKKQIAVQECNFQ